MKGGIRAYARHRGCSAPAVRKAIADGRIAPAVTGAGNETSIDFDLADRLWKRNSDPAAKHRDSQRLNQPPAATVDEQASNVVSGETFQEARTRRERAEADQAEFDRDVQRNKYMPAEEVKAAFRAIGEMRASNREGMPRQLAPLLVGKTDLSEIETILRRELRSVDERETKEITSRYGNLTSTDGNGSIAV